MSLTYRTSTALEVVRKSNYNIVDRLGCRYGHLSQRRMPNRCRTCITSVAFKGYRMADSALLNELIAVHLRYTPVAGSLRIRAIGQLAAKVLFTVPQGQTAALQQIARDVAVTANIASVLFSDVEGALRLLAELDMASTDGIGWSLTEKGLKEIEADLDRTRKLIDGAIERHFSQALPKQQLRDWFRSICVEYLGQYGTYWAASIAGVPTKMPAGPSLLNDIVPRTCSEHTLEGYAEALSSGFVGFIESNDRKDQDLMWSLGQAMLAARLIAATVGMDPITSREVRDSLFLLDTNVLLVASLESHRLAASLAVLVKTLKALNIRLCVLPLTKDEYEAVVEEKRTQVLPLIGRFPLNVLDEANDTFLSTALSRGCRTVEDFERFFDEISVPPSEIDEEMITFFEDEHVALAAQDGSADAELKRQVAEVWRVNRPYQKRPMVVAHDAGLLRAVEDANARGQRSYVLTMDRTMHQLSARRSGEHGLPTWVTLDALLQILAVDLGGAELQAEMFGPLLAAVLENEAQPISGTYTAEDLAWLLDIEERCAGLSAEKVKSVATRIARARLSGKRKNDPELQLIIQRSFQSDRLAYEKEASAARLDLAAVRKDLKVETERARIRLEALIAERAKTLRGQALKSFLWKASLSALWGVLLFAAGIWLARRWYGEDSPWVSIGIPALLFAGGAACLPQLVRLLSALSKSRVSARAQAERQLENIDRSDLPTKNQSS